MADQEKETMNMAEEAEKTADAEKKTGEAAADAAETNDSGEEEKLSHGDKKKVKKL